MTIRKKLQISNILMLVIPVGVIAAVGVFCITFWGNHYFDALEDMFEYDDGIYSAQSLMFSYWGDFETDPVRAAAGLQAELAAMDFHVRVQKNDGHFASNLTDQDEECEEELTEGMLSGTGSLSVTRNGKAVIYQTDTVNGTEWEITAVRSDESAAEGFSGSYLRTWFFQLITILGVTTLGTIVLTNFCLTHWVSRSILKPLKALREGANLIEKGDLDFTFPVLERNEIGEVSEDFDSMRERLREAALTKLEYENYKKELLAGISHDLRTPLTSIKGYADGLIEGIADTEEKRQRYYRAIRLRAGDMEKLADNLSSISRLETEKLKVKTSIWQVSAFVGRLLEGYAVEAEKKHILFLNQIKEPDIWVRLDEPEMKRVFVNLFENSVKYRTKEQSVIRLWERKRGGFVELGISDDGPGVPEKELSNIFNSFYRGDQSRTNPGKGSGLGLAVAKQIVESHGGMIWAENENGAEEAGNGHGLTVMIRLPVYEEEEHA